MADLMLGDDVRDAIPELRQAAESMMSDVASIYRPGPDVFDPDTGLMTGSETTVHANRPCWLRMPTAVESQRLFGEEQVTATRYIACFPHDTTGVEVEDVIRFSQASDPDVLTRTYRILAVPSKTIVHFKGFGCEVVE